MAIAYTVVGVLKGNSERFSECVTAESPREAQIKIAKSMKGFGESGIVVASVFLGNVIPLEVDTETTNGLWPFFSANIEATPEERPDENFEIETGPRFPDDIPGEQTPP